MNKAYGIPVGVYVVSVSETGAAKKAGIQQGDIITKINDQTVKTIDAVQEIVNNTKAGTDIQVTIQRSDNGEYKEKQLTVTLKTKDTLAGLDDGSDSTDGQNSQNDQNNQNNNGGSYDYGNGSGNGNGSQVIPWGGSTY